MTCRWKMLLAAVLSVVAAACGAVEEERCSGPLFCAEGLVCFTMLPDTSEPTTTRCLRPCSLKEQTGCRPGEECVRCGLHCENDEQVTGFCADIY